MKFNLPYNRQSFENLLSSTLFGDKYAKDYKSINIDRKTIFFDEKSCFVLGKVSLDRDIYIFEMKQKSKKDPRITLTKDAFKIMEDIGANYALVIFYSDDSKSYRLSLLTRKKIFGEKEESDPKRYSFLLGEGEKTKTPENQLHKPIHNFNELFEAFNVEVVRKEFFNNYLDLYVRLYREIIKDENFTKLLKSQGVDIVSFVKTLLGKLVFLYFIQKKGWLGVDKDGKWGEGKKDFMRWLWDSRNNITFEKTGNFYNDCLEHLFYNGLNSPSRLFNSDYDLNFKCRIPYLNGGLFKEDYEFEKFEAHISNDIFSNQNGDGILDIFDTYNFTIDEDDLYDREVAVDPEMLGKIFEKMISISSENIDTILKEYTKNESSGKKKKLEIDNVLNKKLGAFYTPREIVHYMTKESLIAYLVNNLKGKKEEKKENEAKIRRLFELKEQFLVTKSEITESTFDTLASSITEIDELLKKVKVLDPAVGSGAFPMGLLHEVATIRYYIYGVFYETFGVNTQEYKNESGKISMYKIKRDVIQNNIYGVDISAGAIEIARLRFWLSLVVDEETPEPLPNFEFKFVCANTLIPLEEEQKQGQLELEEVQKELNLDTLKNYMSKFYNAQTNKDKDDWKNRIENFLGIKEFSVKSLDLYNTKSARTKQLETYEPFNPNHSAGFFDPGLMMGNSKFDIIIGNPPYIKEDENKNVFVGLKNKPYYMGKMDLWYYFACYGLDLLKDGGIQSFIAQNNWITSFGAKIMRNKILEDAKIKEFIDFGDFKVFETAGIQTMIYILEKTKNNQNYEVKYSKLENKNFIRNRINEFLSDNFNSDEYIKHYSKINKISYKNKTIDFADNQQSILLNKINGIGTFKLKSNEVFSGIDISQDFVNKKSKEILGNNYKVGDGIFVLSQTELNNLNLHDNEKELLKPFYKGDDFIGYFANYKNKYWIIYTDSSYKNINSLDKYPKIKNHLDKFQTIITSENKPYGLNRARKDGISFIGEKIISKRKSPNTPSFTYVDFDTYFDRTFMQIITKRIHLKYLTGVLNSKIIKYWLKYKGKMQGNNYQVDKDPILSIPIKESSQEKQNIFIEKVDKIMEITKQPFYDPKNPPKEQKDLEDEIDRMVYELYGLSDEEVRVVEESLEK